MITPARPLRSTEPLRPSFDVARQRFLDDVRDMLADPDLRFEEKADHIEGTIKAIRSLWSMKVIDDA